MPVSRAWFPEADSPTTEGQRLLCERVETATEVAQALGNVSVKTATKWLRGTKPRHEHRLALVRTHEIPYAAWDTLPGETLPVAEMPTAPDLDDPDEPEPGDGDSIGMLDRQIRELRVEIRSSVGTARANLMATLQRCISFRAKLEQERLSDEQKIFRSPAWQRIKQAQIEVLKRYPKAAEEIARVLNALGDR